MAETGLAGPFSVSGIFTFVVVLLVAVLFVAVVLSLNVV